MSLVPEKMAGSSNDPPPKRHRAELGHIIASTGLAVAPQAKSHGLSKRDVAREVHKHDDVATPFGPLYRPMQLRTSDDTVQVEAMNPFAMLWYVAHLSSAAAGFFAAHLTSGVCRVAFYCDGVKPGNVLRPDLGRSFEAVYWTFMEFPDWFRTRVGESWFLFAFVESKLVQRVPGGMAAVAKAVVDSFFPASDDEFNFSKTGMLFGHNGREYCIRARFGCWLADEKALKEVVSCKGSSGYKPCVSCKNVVNRTMPADDSPLVHISCADPTKFDTQTFESLSFMATDLVAKKGTVSRAEFDLLQKCYGVVYTAEAMLFDEHCRKVVRFPETIYWDWMHCLVASGGVAQYQCNGFLLALKASGIALASVDEFCNTVCVPSGWSKLTKSFFKDRVVENLDAHMKAFASEMLSAIVVLGIFVDAVVRPTGKLADHVACFDCLRTLVLILKRGDGACPLVAELQRQLRLHHDLFVVLYPACVKPKLHYLKHCVDCIGRFGRNLSCLGPERKHKDAKSVAAFTFNKAWLHI